MTDFEIIEIENEHRRLINADRDRREEEARRTEIQERERLIIEARALDAEAEIEARALDAEAERLENLENMMMADRFANHIINCVIPYHIEGAQIQVSPLSSQNSSSDSDDTIDSNSDFPIHHTSQNDEYAEDEETESEEEDTPIESSATDTDTTNDESYGSAQSTNSPDPSSTDTESIQIDEADQQLPLRYNDINFIYKLNQKNGSRKGNKRVIISSIRPSFSCSSHHDFFICHVCYRFPKPVEKWKTLTNEHPFVRNIGSIFKHLLINHCGMEELQVNASARFYILSQLKELTTKPETSFLQTTTSIPKAISTSCLNVPWKSNQTELTKEIANTYYFGKRCSGHSKLVEPEGHGYMYKGEKYMFDLSNTVYCSCHAKTMTFARFKITSRKTAPIPQYYHRDGSKIEEDAVRTFFTSEKGSIHHTHPLLLCRYKYDMKIGNGIPKIRTYPTGTTTTRSQTRAMQSNLPAQPDQANIGSSGSTSKGNNSGAQGNQARVPYQKEKGKSRTKTPNAATPTATPTIRGAASKIARMLDFKKKANPTI